MWEWLANDPWPVFGVLFAAACLAAWWSRRSNSQSAFMAALVLLILALAPMFAGLFVETPMKQVDRLVRDLAAAGEARDAKRIAEALDPDYRFGGYTKEKLTELIERELKNYRPDWVSISDVAIETTKTGDKETATASFRANTGGKYEGGIGVVVPRYPVRLKLNLIKRNGRWRVTEIHRYDPNVAQEQEIELGSHRW